MCSLQSANHGQGKILISYTLANIQSQGSFSLFYKSSFTLVAVLTAMDHFSEGGITVTGRCSGGCLLFYYIGNFV